MTLDGWFSGVVVGRVGFWVHMLERALFWVEGDHFVCLGISGSPPLR